MTVALVAVLAESSTPPIVQAFPIGLLAFGIFTFLAIISLSYRNVANRHSGKAAAYAKAHENDVVRPGHGH